MRVLITGGAGFIGSHVVDALLEVGHEPYVVDNLVSGSRANLPPEVPLFDVDVCDRDALTRVFHEVQPHSVSHQAAQMSVSRSVREPVFDAEVNVLGLLNVFELAVQTGSARIVFASSGGVLYGDVEKPATEQAPCEPVSPYGISKWVGEQYLKFFVREHGIQGVALRYANVYGPRQNPHGEAGVVAIFSRKMLAGEQATVNGDGLYFRDYVCVTDVARANALALTIDLAEKFVALNIGTGLRVDVNELAAAVRDRCQRVRGEAADVPEPRHADARAGDLRSSVVSAAKAHRLLGWEPRVDFASGLRQTVDWFAAQNDRADTPT
jgi:UDP-glucose 4-epimerase